MWAELFNLEADPGELWHEPEFASVFRHQLQTRLDDDLKTFDPEKTATLLNVDPQTESVPHTFGELIAHPRPSLELLDVMKDFAKQQGAEQDGQLPVEVSKVLYLCAISAALVRRGARITQMSDDSLKQRLAWAAEREWLEGPTRELLSAAVDLL